MDELSLAQARRLALAAQGFDRPRPRRVDRRQLAQLIRRLGLLQVDFVNVVVPSHYQVPFSRLGPYPRERLDEVVYASGQFHEQWAHEASILPNESWPLLAERRRTFRIRPWGFDQFIDANPDYVQEVIQELQRRGPTLAADLPVPAGVDRRIENLWPSAETHDGWYRSVPRATLDYHHARGRVAVCGRLPNFTRVYDLIERHVPREARQDSFETDEAERRLLEHAGRALGVGTAADLADYYRMKVGAARPRLEELVEGGALVHARVEGWRDVAYRHPAVKLPRRVRAATLLSPFDPLIWFRPRAARLFGFEYKVEIFVPPKKREYGFYVLPFLLGERLVARVDLKVKRDERQLAVLGAWREEDAREQVVASALSRELRSWAEWLGLEGVSAGRRGNLARGLGRALRA